MTSNATPPKLQFLDSNGAPLVGGKLYTYAAGTTTPQTSYTDYGGGTANTNPVILDSRGEASVWLDTAMYKMALYDSDNVLIWTVDNLNGGDVATLAELAASGGSNLIGFLQAGTGAVATTVQTKLRESVSIEDFGAVGDGVTDDTAAIQAAINAVIASTLSRSLYVPRGVFKITSGLTFASPIRIFGDGYDISAETGSVIKTTQTSGVAFEFNNAVASFDSGLILENFMVVGPNSGSAVGFQIEGAVWPNTQIRGLTAKSMGSHGFYFVDCISANVENCRSQGNGGSGYVVSQSNAIKFRGCTAESNGSHGWNFTNSGISGERIAPSLVQCLSEENAGDAIYMNQYTGIMISECYLQVASLSNVDYACIRIDTSTAIRVINNHITSNVAWPLFSGVKFVGGLFCEVIGNNFTGGFISGQDIVEDASSGRNIAFGNSGNGTQGMASFTTASATGSVYHSQMGSGSDYGQEWYAGYQRFKNLAGTTQFDATSAGVKVYSPAGASSYTYPLYLGAYSLWVDSTGDLRIKSGAPTSNTDGTVVGTQT